MNDIAYCLNWNCLFTDCERHYNKAPRNVPISMAWLDKTCRRYIRHLVDEQMKDGE